MISSKLVGKTMYVGLDGELDESTAVYTRTKLDAVLSDERIAKVVVELSQLKFMDSTGIGVLLGRYKRMKTRGVSVYLANPTKSIDKILTLSGLYGIMPKVESREEA